MSDNNFINQYFDKAKKIHDLCIDKLNLRVDDARLYTYIYVKSVENNGLDYFSKDDLSAIEALKCMLNSNSKNTELIDRLKLHTDIKFASEKISFYINNIMMEIEN